MGPCAAVPEGEAKLKILVVRNDRLGDFMLAYPSFALLKRSMPEAEVAVLASGYTREMAEACAWIDRVVEDPEPSGGWLASGRLGRLIRAEGFDAVIALWATRRTGLGSMLAGVPYRLGSATKIAQVFFNRRLRQRRSDSEKPEFEYNLDLVRRFLADQGVSAADQPGPPYLHFDSATVGALEETFRAEHSISGGEKLVFVHPGFGGSAANLELDQYARLARSLRSRGGHVVVVTAGPGELERARSLSERLGETRHVIYESNRGLRLFAQHLQFADVFIGGSTGTLHVAGALDRPTAGFYPLRRSATSCRWRTLNSEANRLAFRPPESAGDAEMAAVDVEGAAEEISARFLLDG